MLTIAAKKECEIHRLCSKGHKLVGIHKKLSASTHFKVDRKDEDNAGEAE